MTVSVVSFIFDAQFAPHGATGVDVADMHRAVAWWVMDGGEIGCWQRRTREDDADLVVVALYASPGVRSRSGGRAGEAVVACFAMTRPGARELFADPF